MDLQDDQQLDPEKHKWVLREFVDQYDNGFAAGKQWARDNPPFSIATPLAFGYGFVTGIAILILDRWMQSN